MTEPDITELEPGHTVIVEYESKRSGNRLERSGDVVECRTVEDKYVVYVHTEARSEFEHKYVALCDTGDGIGAVSVTTEAETINGDWGEKPARSRPRQ